MSSQDSTNTDPKELEKLYREHFEKEETTGIPDNDTSLLQPTPLKHVESYTTYGVATDLLINQE